MLHMCLIVYSSRRRDTRCALVTGVQTCALPISNRPPGVVATTSVNVPPRSTAKRQAFIFAILFPAWRANLAGGGVNVQRRGAPARFLPARTARPAGADGPAVDSRCR